MLRRATLSLAFTVAACEPWTLDGGDDEPPWTPLPTAPPAAKPAVVPASPASAESGALGGFVECLLRCDAPGLPRVQRAKCRYECEGLNGAPDNGVQSRVDIDPVDTVVQCMTRCPVHGARGATCVDACERLVSDSPGSPSATVLDELGACIRDCGKDRPLKPTDRSTCELNCAAVARSAGPDQREKP